MKLYGVEKTEEEIKNFVVDYIGSVKSNKHDRFHTILSLVPEGGKYILDYGCGWGHYAIAMKEKGNKVKAIDISQNCIDICHLVWGKQENPEFECNSIENINNETFDCVLSNQVIEHVHNPGMYLFYQINRVLKPDGQLIIALPNIMNLRFLFRTLRPKLEDKLKKLSKNFLTKYDKTHDHINSWDPFHFVTLCASCGFLLERFVPTEGVALPFGKYIQIKNWLIGNLSYTMVFSFKKIKFVKIDSAE